MGLGSLLWGVVLSVAAVMAWSVGTPLAWGGFALLVAVFASLVVALQLRR